MKVLVIILSLTVIGSLALSVRLGTQLQQNVEALKRSTTLTDQAIAQATEAVAIAQRFKARFEWLEAECILR